VHACVCLASRACKGDPAWCAKPTPIHIEIRVFSELTKPVLSYSSTVEQTVALGTLKRPKAPAKEIPRPKLRLVLMSGSASGGRKHYERGSSCWPRGLLYSPRSSQELPGAAAAVLPTR
jgi:hypothetical protein